MFANIFDTEKALEAIEIIRSQFLISGYLYCII